MMAAELVSQAEVIGGRVALAELVNSRAFPGPTMEARKKAGLRWVLRDLSAALRAKIGRRWHVSLSARLPDGQTVESFLRCGEKPASLGQYRLPPASSGWSEADRQRFLDTHRLLGLWDEFRAARPGRPDRPIVAMFARSHGEWAKSKGLSCDLRSLRRYRRRVTPGNPSFDGNIDCRGRPSVAAEDHTELCSLEAWEMFNGLVLHQNKLRLASAYRYVKGEAKRLGWAWPSLSWVRLRFHAEVPKPAQVLARHGERKFEAECTPKIKRHYDDICAGDWWSLDGRQFDFMARAPDARAGWRRIRPVLTAVLDMRSRKFLGWDIREHENADGVAAGVKMAIREGLPWHVGTDCGNAYKKSVGSRRANRRKRFADPAVIGMFALFKVTIHQSIAYHAWAKPIESIWNNVKNGFDRWMKDAFWGGSPRERPEGMDAWTRKRIDQLWTLEQVRDSFRTYLGEYHDTPQNGDGMYGLTPNLAWEQYRHREVRHVPEDFIDVLCARLEGPLKVTKNGVRYRNIYYGQTEPEVWKLQGKNVLLRIDPARADQVIVCDSKGVPLCLATQDRLSGCTQEDIRESSRIKERFRRMMKEHVRAADYLANTPTTQVLETKRRHAKTEAAELRKHLPPPKPPQTIAVVTPQYAEITRQAKAPRPRACSDVDPFGSLANLYSSEDAEGPASARWNAQAAWDAIDKADRNVPAWQDAGAEEERVGRDAPEPPWEKLARSAAE